VEATLTGQALSKAIELCEANFVLDLQAEALRKMAYRGNLEKLFPQLFLRDMVEQALISDTPPRQTQLPPSTTPQPPTKQHLTTDTLLMPSSKHYGCFASHKKTHTKHGDAREVGK
jgi:hypothetical protein